MKEKIEEYIKELEAQIESYAEDVGSGNQDAFEGFCDGVITAHERTIEFLKELLEIL